MSAALATAQVFLTALRALPREARDAVILSIASDKAYAREILDLAVIADRRREPSRAFRQYLAKKHRE